MQGPLEKLRGLGRHHPPCPIDDYLDDVWIGDERKDAEYASAAAGVTRNSEYASAWALVVTSSRRDSSTARRSTIHASRRRLPTPTGSTRTADAKQVRRPCPRPSHC